MDLPQGILRVGGVQKIGNHTIMVVDAYPQIINHQAINSMADKIAQLQKQINYLQAKTMSPESGNIQYGFRWARDTDIPFTDDIGMTTNHVDLMQLQLWLSHYEANKLYIKDETNWDDLKDKYKGKCAVIIGSGYSIMNNGHLVQKLDKTKCVTITINRAGSVFNSDFWLVIDAQAHVDKWTPQNPATVPIFSPFVNSDLARRIQVKGLKPRWFRYVIPGKFNSQVKEDFPNLQPFDDGTNATYTAIQIARFFGCEDIAFIGHDFGMTNGMRHFDEPTSFHDQTANVLPNVVVCDMWGRSYISNEDYITDCKFCICLCSLLSELHNVRFYNCSEEGIFYAPGITEKRSFSSMVNDINSGRITEMYGSANAPELPAVECRDNAETIAVNAS